MVHLSRQSTPLKAKFIACYINVCIIVEILYKTPGTKSKSSIAHKSKNTGNWYELKLGIITQMNK